MTSRVPRPDTETMAERILMIDDDSRLAGMVSDYLGGAGFRLTIAGTAGEGEALLKRETFDAIILDLMLPDADGLDLCRRLRTGSDLPLLMLTARRDRADPTHTPPTGPRHPTGVVLLRERPGPVNPSTSPVIRGRPGGRPQS